jgi:hypothetical protein
MILHYASSAKRYRAALLNRNVPPEQIRSVAVYRKALSEFKNEVYVTADWVASLSTTMSAFKVSIPANHLKGYIQHIEKDERLEITIYSENQLNCLYRTPYEDRVLHIDATGSQVKIKKNSSHKTNFAFIIEF